MSTLRSRSLYDSYYSSRGGARARSASEASPNTICDATLAGSPNDPFVTPNDRQTLVRSRGNPRRATMLRGGARTRSASEASLNTLSDAIVACSPIGPVPPRDESEHRRPHISSPKGAGSRTRKIVDLSKHELVEMPQKSKRVRGGEVEALGLGKNIVSVEEEEETIVDIGKAKGSNSKSSPYKGVTFYKRTRRWETHIWDSKRINKKQIYLGAYSTEVKAARAYDRAAIHFGKVACGLNFPIKDYSGELNQLAEISDDELEKMLRKQSRGVGSEYPIYPEKSSIESRGGGSEYPICPERSSIGCSPISRHISLDNQEVLLEIKSTIIQSGRNPRLESLNYINGVHSPQTSSVLKPKAVHVSQRLGHYWRILDSL